MGPHVSHMFPGRLLRVTAGLLLLVVVFTFGAAADRAGLLGSSSAHTAGLPAQFGVLTQALTLIRQHYVDQTAIDPTKFAYAATGAMVDALGDTGHSQFLPPDQAKAAQSALSGQFEGIGAEVGTRDGQTVIIAPIAGSPAEHAGVRAGDIITQVNGTTTSGMTLTQVVSLVRGPAGTTVSLTVVHAGATTPADITIVRAKLDAPNVDWAFVPATRVAQVHVSDFDSHATDQLKAALSDAKAQGATGVILDLRNNPGGELSEAVSSASQFVDSGTILIQRDVHGKDTPIAAEKDGVATTIPLVVLINEGTASGAEIVAGAIQDHHRGPVVGATTFGTGTVLNQFPLAGGAELLLGTEEWLTPSGRLIWHHGIVPDDPVAMPANATPVFPNLEAAGGTIPSDPQLNQALSLLPH